MAQLNPKIKIEHPDYSDDEFSDSDLPPLIPISTFVDYIEVSSGLDTTQGVLLRRLTQNELIY
jgi:hypothetical protein